MSFSPSPLSSAFFSIRGSMLPHGRMIRLGMKRVLVALVVSCGGSQPSVTLPPVATAIASVNEAHPRPNPLPAGACGFDGSLSQGCRANARWAVIAATARDEAEATKALARARSAPVVDGYPF